MQTPEEFQGTDMCLNFDINQWGNWNAQALKASNLNAQEAKNIK